MSTHLVLDKFSNYQKLAKQTITHKKEGLMELYYATLGLAGEAGEIANKVKKIIRDDNNVLTDEKRKQIVDELGDVLWYLSDLCNEMDTTLAQIAQSNIDKLFDRKERGKLQGSGDNR